MRVNGVRGGIYSFGREFAIHVYNVYLLCQFGIKAGELCTRTEQLQITFGAYLSYDEYLRIACSRVQLVASTHTVANRIIIS
jgi:hypothetical protein